MFSPEERLELIEGEIIERGRQSASHATGICACAEECRRVFGVGHDVRTQLPLAVSEYNQPDPDVAVLPGSFRDYEDDHPATAVLVIEVADTSLAYDRAVKASLYARAGVPEYWVLNLTDRLLEVHRQPAELSGEPGGHHYRSIERYAEEQTVAPLAVPGAGVLVSALLPTRKPGE